MGTKTFNQIHIFIGNILEDIAMQDFSVLVLVVHTALIKALRRQRQKDLCEFKASLAYIVVSIQLTVQSVSGSCFQFFSKKVSISLVLYDVTEVTNIK